MKVGTNVDPRASELPYCTVHREPILDKAVRTEADGRW